MSTTIGVLTPDSVRRLYLRGIDLGAAWQGTSADITIAGLIAVELSRAEAMMGIHWHRARVLTWPDAGLVPGQDYEVLGQLLPYTPQTPEMTTYALTLHYHDVQAVTRVRLYVGLDTASPPAPVFQALPLDQMVFAMAQERLYIPTALVSPEPDPLPQGWAVDYLIGVGTLPPEIAAWCALGAAIETLAMAGSGQDVTHGQLGELLIMDGVEERHTYGSGAMLAMGGLYAGPISILQRARDDIDLSRLRFRYQNTLGDTQGIPAGALRPTWSYEQTVCAPPATGVLG